MMMATLFSSPGTTQNPALVQIPLSKAPLLVAGMDGWPGSTSAGSCYRPAGRKSMATAGSTTMARHLQGFWATRRCYPRYRDGPAITYGWYRDFIQYMLDHDWYTWFAWLITFGELSGGSGVDHRRLHCHRGAVWRDDELQHTCSPVQRQFESRAAVLLGHPYPRLEGLPDISASTAGSCRHSVHRGKSAEPSNRFRRSLARKGLNGKTKRRWASGDRLSLSRLLR